MEPDHARAIAERLHADDHALLEHIRRVVLATPAEGCAVAWLHEALDAGAVREHDLLREGLWDAELRALRLLTLPCRVASDTAYLAYLDLIARAAGRSGLLAGGLRPSPTRTSSWRTRRSSSATSTPGAGS